jgi:hypothetical protein
MCGAVLSTIGLVASLAGVVLLFRYGMPYEIRRGGARYIQFEQIDPTQVGREARYGVLGWSGLVLIVIGTLFQIAGAWAPK